MVRPRASPGLDPRGQRLDPRAASAAYAPVVDRVQRRRFSPRGLRDLRDRARRRPRCVTDGAARGERVLARRPRVPRATGPVAAVFDTWAAAMRAVGDPGFPMAYASAFSIESYPILGFAVL